MGYHLSYSSPMKIRSYAAAKRAYETAKWTRRDTSKVRTIASSHYGRKKAFFIRQRNGVYFLYSPYYSRLHRPAAAVIYFPDGRILVRHPLSCRGNELWADKSAEVLLNCWLPFDIQLFRGALYVRVNGQALKLPRLAVFVDGKLTNPAPDHRFRLNREKDKILKEKLAQLSETYDTFKTVHGNEVGKVIYDAFAALPSTGPTHYYWAQEFVLNMMRGEVDDSTQARLLLRYHHDSRYDSAVALRRWRRHGGVYDLVSQPIGSKPLGSDGRAP